jgi:hypothetical protein
MVGFNVKVAKYLAGGKTALKVGDTIFVSPAMHDLISHAEDSDALKLLFENIKLLELPKPSTLYGMFPTIPMTTSWAG